MLAGLTPEFMAHKGSYWRLGVILLTELTNHTREHSDQIRTAVATAAK